MKLRTIIVAAFICGSIIARTSVAQTNQLGAAYVSAHLGAFVTSQSGFSDTYDSNLGFAFGAGVGLPLANQLYLCAKVSYFSKSGTPWWYTYGQGGIISRERSGSAKFSQWIVNGGLQYDFFLSRVYSLGIGAGLTYTSFSEKLQESNGTGSVNETGKGFLGFYGGLSSERSFEGSPFAIFADAQYNYARQVITAAVGNYGGVNLSAGVRYYFGQRSKE